MASPSVNQELVQIHRPYRPSSFIERTKELETVSSKIRQAQTEEMIVEPVVNFWGVSGIGKTWLLQHLQHTYNFPAETPAEPPLIKLHPTFALYYTFENNANIPLPTLARSLANQTRSQLEKVLRKEDDAALVQVINGGDIKLFTSLLRKLSRQYVPLVLLDNTEKLDGDDWTELEQELVEPLVSTNRVLVIIAGRRRAPRMRRFEVRRRVMEPSETRIRPFSKDQVDRQIERQGYHISAEWLFPYTGGNPHLVDAIGQHIRDWTQGHEPGRAWLDQHQNDLLLPILQAYEEHLLVDIPTHLRTVLQAVSPLRSYRLEALRFMLATWDTQTNLPDGHYLTLLRELEQKTEVVWWSHQRRAYKTDGMVRRVMNRCLLLQNAPEYTRRHRQALQMYWEWAKEYPEASEDFILEIWFHLASLYLADKNLEDLQAGGEEARLFAQEKLTQDRWLVLQNQLLDKGDEELIALLPDQLYLHLKQVLFPEEYNV